MDHLEWNLPSEMQIIDRLEELNGVISIFPKDELEYVRSFAAADYKIPDPTPHMKYVVCVLHAVEKLEKELNR